MPFFVNILLVFSLFLCQATQTKKSPIEGYWTGTITQNEGGYRSQYLLELELKEVDGKITGKSYVKVDDIFAEMDVSGVFANGSMLLTLHDDAVVKKRIGPEMEWCLKNYRLKLIKENDKWRLEGQWEGTTSFRDCIPGKIFLVRGVYRA